VIPAGERKSHRVICHWDGADGRGTDASLGRLEWSAAVLDERTVDIQVSLATLPREDGGEAGSESLDRQHQVRSLQGKFAPEEDEKYSDAEASAAMEAVVFDFDNTSSWLTEKTVELVTIRTAAQPHNGLVPLPALAPLGPLPRPDQGTVPPLTTQALPDLRVPAETCIPTAESDATRFVRQLDALLAAAESKCPQGGAESPGADDLAARVLELRSHCNKVLQDILPEKATVMSPADISKAADEGFCQ